MRRAAAKRAKTGRRAGVRVVVVDEAGARRIASAAVRRIAAAALAAEGVRTGELDVLVTRDVKIRALNRSFRGKDKATNVLSWPGTDGHIGDVAISVDYVERQGKETGAGFRYTFVYYLVHGILHLLGYDHHRPADARRMYRRTEEILEACGEG